MLFAIGDIHGTYTALTTLMGEMPITANDKVVFLGDYVDKGPKTKQVLDWLIVNSRKHDFIFLKGNHEIMMLEARHSRDALYNWQWFGGEKTLNSYGIGNNSDWAEEIDPKHWQFMENTLPYFETEHHIFVHAGLQPGVPLEQQTDDDLYWKKFRDPKPYAEGKTVIFGHTSQKTGEIAHFGHAICIDTYAHGGMWLTGLNVETGEYYQANENSDFVTRQL